MRTTISFENENPPASEAALGSLERRLGQALPRSYRAFLAARDGAEPASNEFDVPDASTSSGVNAFFGIDEIKEETRGMKGRLPRGVLPIADAEGGNLVCLSLRQVDHGSVYFWDHELEEDDLAAALFLLARDFQDFLELLLPSDEESAELEEGQVLEVWVRPDSKLKG